MFLSAYDEAVMGRRGGVTELSLRNHRVIVGAIKDGKYRGGQGPDAAQGLRLPVLRGGRPRRLGDGGLALLLLP